MKEMIIAGRLEALETEIKGLMHKTALGMLEMGDKLIEAKSLVPHGRWEAWLEKNVELSARTARNLMAIAQAFPGNRQSLADLNVTTLYLLAEMAEIERNAFLSENEIGKMTTRELKAAIHEMKPKSVLLEPLFTDEMKQYHEEIIKSGTPEAIEEWRKLLLGLAQDTAEIVLLCEQRIGELLNEKRKELYGSESKQGQG